MNQRPLNVLQITSGRNVNGAVIYCGLLGQELASRGHQVFTMCRPNSWFEEKFAGAHQQIVHSTMKRRPSVIRKAIEFIKANEIDLIHTHMSSAHFFGVILKSLCGVTCVATAHSVQRQLHWPFNDFVIANSNATRDFQIQKNFVSKDKIKTVYCYSDLKKYLEAPHWSPQAIRRQQRVADDSKLIGVIGDVVDRKGHIYLVRALPDLVKKYPDLTVLFVGSYHKRNTKYMRLIRRFLLKNNLHRRVRWLGRRDDVPKLIKSLDVCVVPSVKEPLGLVAIEALACGVPVVASNTGGLPEIVQHEQSGILVPPKDSNALVEAISKCLDHPEMCREFANRGVDFVKSTFEPVRLTSQIEQIYMDSLDKRDLMRRNPNKKSADYHSKSAA